MNLLLIYYTGTYNTRFLTNKVSECFQTMNSTVDLLEITATSKPIQTTGYDYIGFSYPIYGFNAPHPFIKYLKTLHFPLKQKYFIYKNSGETLAMNNASSRKIIRYMKKFQASFCGEYHFVMPYNIHFEFAENFIKQIICEDKKLLEIMIYNLNHQIAPQIKSNWLYNLGAFFVSIQAIGGNVNSFFYKVDQHKCNLCGRCVKNCPHQNIVLKKNRIFFKHTCDMCMRCSFYCPQKAIKIGILEGWKVHRYYDLEKIWNQDNFCAPYITNQSKGFYKCFIKTFQEIDDRYLEIKKSQ